MTIIHLEQDKFALAAPENQSGLLAIRIHRQGVRYYVCTPLVGLKIETGTATIASFNDAQLFDRVHSIGGWVAYRCVIEKPPNDRRFSRCYGSVHGLWALVPIMPNGAARKGHRPC